MEQSSWSKGVEDHYLRKWGDFAPCLFSRGPIHELPADFGVLCFSPSLHRNMWTYATRGMAQPGDERPLELHIVSPRQEGGIVELLHAVAHFHRTGATLALGHSVNFGRPWLDDSTCDRGLLSLPYLDGPSLEDCDNIGVHIRCLWLVPITAAEADYKQKHGLEALEQRFEQSSFNYLDPHRSSVA